MPTPELFAALFRSHIFASVFRASAEAMVTGNAARLALMQQAELDGFLLGQMKEPAMADDVLQDGSGNVCCHGESDGSQC